VNRLCLRQAFGFINTLSLGFLCPFFLDKEVSCSFFLKKKNQKFKASEKWLKITSYG
jgi:hypothetical protein